MGIRMRYNDLMNLFSKAWEKCEKVPNVGYKYTNKNIYTVFDGTKYIRQCY